ncbi:MAG: alpha-amlyase [Saprospirales bacterium]|nr:MAG: alpha-amlyase [Saprospirales bacterium]
MKKYYILVFAIFVFFISCKMEPTKEQILFSDPISIKLQPETTELVLADFFNKTDVVLVKDCPSGLICEIENHSILRLTVKGDLNPLEVLSLDYNGITVDFLLKRSEKVLAGFSFESQGKNIETVSVVGDINSWNPAEGKMERDEEGIWRAEFWLNPGLYGYQFEINGERILDPANPDSLDNGMGGFNSKLFIEEIDEMRLPHLFTKMNSEGIPCIEFDPSFSDMKILLGSRHLDYKVGEADCVNLVELLSPFPDFSGFVLVQAVQTDHYGPDLKIPVKNGKVVLDAGQLSVEDWHRTIMYFMMVDRFYNANPDNDQPVDDPRILPIANHFGGDLEGINKKLADGYFSDLNFNSIWMSPIVQNPEGAYGFWDKGGVQSKFSGYHGYWPISFTDIDYRFGVPADLHRMVELAGEKEFSILLDLVANHVHEEHPFYQENKGSDFFTDLYLPDGSLNTERWDDHRLTTWFDTFMPTMDLSIHEVADVVSESAIYWLEEYGVHGFRHDATKHVDLYFWRMLTQKIKQLSAETGQSYLQIGETYGTPELISSYIGPGMLDAQFDFNVYDAVLNSIIRDEFSFETLASRLRQSRAYYGTNHLMGNMSGNQDKPRIMSLSTAEVAFDEDTKLAGWTREINAMTEEGFQKVGMIHALNYFIPGIPVMYYGDEIGMPGGNDPDNRRMMIFEGLTDEQMQLRDMVAQLGDVRSNRMELIYGNFIIHQADEDIFIGSRNYFGNRSILILNSSEESLIFDPETIDFDNNSQRLTLFSKHGIEHDPGQPLEIPARGFELIFID